MRKEGKNYLQAAPGIRTRRTRGARSRSLLEPLFSKTPREVPAPVLIEACRILRKFSPPDFRPSDRGADSRKMVFENQIFLDVSSKPVERASSSIAGLSLPVPSMTESAPDFLNPMMIPASRAFASPLRRQGNVPPPEKSFLPSLRRFS